MTKLQIISKLWSLTYDLLLHAKGYRFKNIEEIEANMDILEYECRKYSDTDDMEGTP